MAALLVRDLMTDRVISVRRSTRMDEVYDLMLDHGFRHVPVVDEDDELVGIVSQRDVAALLGPESRGPLMRQAELLSDQRAADVMTPAVETVEPDDDLVVAAEILLEYKFSCLPVVEGSRLVGILTESDFVRHAARSG